MITNIEAKDLKTYLEDNNAILIDVRSELEHAESSIDEAVNIPLDQLLSRLDEVPENRSLVMQCRSGGRSSVACLQLIQRGYKNVVNLDGGILAWEEIINL